MEPTKPDRNTFVIGEEASKQHHGHDHHWGDSQSSLFVFKNGGYEVADRGSDLTLHQKGHVEEDKLGERSFEAHRKVNDKTGEQRSDQQNRCVHDDFWGEVRAHWVHFVRLLSEENWPLSLEDQNGVHQIAHEHIGANEEKSAIEFHAGSEKLRIVSFIRLLDIDFAFKAVCMVKAQIVEYHGDDNSKNDLLHDFHSTLHRVSLEAKLVSPD